MSTQSDEINELAAALAKAQGAMHNATMNRTNPHFRSKYADLSSVLDAIRGPLSAAGLSFSQTMHIAEHGMILRTILMHAASGQYLTSEYPLPTPQKPQEFGSALTYAKRYSLAAIVGNASDEDDDGNIAMTKPANGNAKISNDDLMQLRELVLSKEVDIPKLCKYYNIKLNEKDPISSLDNVTTDILPEVVAALEAKRARADA